jgi:hypothetical protein
MAKMDEQRTAARRKAEDLLTRRKQQETERLTNRERDSRAQDEKIARLRALRLAKEAADRDAAEAAKLAKPAAKPARKA